MTESVQVSIGELLDKYSILELKAAFIKDPSKLADINYEIEVLKPIVEKYISLVADEYKMLKDANKIVWDVNDIVRANHEAYSSIQVMQLNDERFKAKHVINVKCKSAIKEHKSYSDLDY